MKQWKYADLPWVEKQGGWLLSLFIHLAIFSFLLTYSPSSKISRNRAYPRQIFLKFSAPKENSADSSKLPEPARATQAMEPEALFTETASANPYEHPAVPHPYESAIAEFRREQEDAAKELAQSFAGLRGEIERRAPAETKAAPADVSSIGAAQGAVRVFDISKVPEAVAATVLERYDIRISQKYMDGGAFNPNYLSSARLRDKTFVNVAGSGFYEVFEVSRRAVQRLILLESREMAVRGLNPDNTRVIKVVFGIIELSGGIAQNEQNDSKGYDLGITEFQFEEIK
ncbi:MAG TPA: hypothetical protein PKW18_05495 [Candidatus Sumerlaeota bacterium]|nr:MAG: hypothetical protein BWY12_02368 [candidate division BRC1 bacterium ADurb.Bin183]HOE62514.1 hypothetical protein [Candidatus Sumerlaeota bacterium]HRR30410.1 hypothetical protein [Candidatus Sumerlaeia bacterium]HON50045.1 hypothetical protein [Candidatus Sumerlaeota bacterium]HOR63261.1 hypothetical protein [Candidatus Sumerlaeota bacterium]